MSESWDLPCGDEYHGCLPDFNASMLYTLKKHPVSAVCSTPSCPGIIAKVIIVDDTNAWYFLSNLIRTYRTSLEVMHSPHVMQQKHIRIADSHAQVVERINKLLAARRVMVALMAVLVGRFDTY